MEEKKEEEISSTIVNNNYYGTEIEEEESSGSSISFSSIWHMIKKHWVGIAVCTIVGLGAAAAYGFLIKKANYQTSAQLIVTDNNTEDDMLSNLNIQKQKAAMCYGYMNTAEVREAVCNYLAPTYKEYDISDASKKDKAMEKLSKQYSIDLDGSSSMFITVSTETPKKQQSIDLANAFVNVTYSLANGSGTLSSYLKGSLTVSETATATDKSTNNFAIAGTGAVIGLAVGIAYAIIRELANTKVTSKYDLEQITGAKVIGMIPDYTDEASRSTKEGNDHE